MESFKEHQNPNKEYVTSLCDNFDVVNKSFLSSDSSKKTLVMSGFVAFMCCKLHFVFLIGKIIRSIQFLVSQQGRVPMHVWAGSQGVKEAWEGRCPTKRGCDLAR
jgi:hypothetical protein